MQWLIDEQSIAWRKNGKQVRVPLISARQAAYRAGDNKVFVLAGQERPTLYVFYDDGAALFTLAPPKNTYFKGFGRNRGQEVALFAVIYQMGWRDWWFAINCQTQELESLGEGR